MHSYKQDSTVIGKMKLKNFGRHPVPGLDFKKKAPSKNGIVSCIFGMAAMAVFIAASIISAKADGDAGEPVGFMGISSALLCIVGLVFASDGMREREVGYLFPVIGAVLNGLLLVYLFWLYIYGLI